jgi:trigger factor
LLAQVLSEEANQRKLKVEISSAEMTPYFEATLEMYREEAQIQGFRKGKAPREVILKKFGDQINSEALPVIVEEFYKQAIKDTNTEAIAIGQIDNVSYKKDQPMTFEVTVEIMPTYEVPNYKGLKVQKEVHDLKDDEVQNTIERLRENYSTMKISETVSAGNFITCDIQMLDHSDLPIIGKKFTDRRIPLTTQFVGQDFIDGLIGAKQGESRKLHVAKGPDAKEGEHEHMMVTIRKIEEVQLPALDDEFAKDLGFENLEKLKTDVKENLRKRWDDDSAKILNERIIDEIIKNNDVPSPEPLVDNALQRIAEMVKQRLKGQKVEDQYIIDRYRATAIRDVKWMLARKKILETEKMTVMPEDIEAYRERMAEHNKVGKDQINIDFKTESEQKNFEDYLIEEKLMKFLQSQSVIEEVSDTLAETQEEKKSNLIV